MRDLKADLQICEAATKGPWLVETKYMDEPGYEQYIKCQSIVTPVDEDNTMHLIARINWCNPVEANAQMMATARTAWPETIRRCMAAEAEVEQLRGLIRNFINCPGTSNGNRCLYDCDKKPCPYDKMVAALEGDT